MQPTGWQGYAGAMRDAAATRERILAAATAEFAEHGLAGARVDRIAAAAASNKAQLYAYVGGKDALFDTIFEAHVAANVDGVPFTADDLPGYAVALYDSYLTDPALVRLASWNRLERVPTGDLLVGHPGLTDPKAAAIAQAQAEGWIVGGIRPDEVYSLVIALAGTWSPISATFAASPLDPPADHDRRRAALRQVVSRALVPRSEVG